MSEVSEGRLYREAWWLGAAILARRRLGLPVGDLEVMLRSDFGDQFFERRLNWAFVLEDP